MTRTIRWLATTVAWACAWAVVSQGVAAEILAVDFAATNSSAYRIDPATGISTLLGLTGFRELNSLARSPAGVHYAAEGTPDGAVPALVTIDPISGIGTFVAPLDFGEGVEVDVRSMAFSADGVLYATTRAFAGGGLYTIDVETGQGTRLATLDISTCQALTFAPDGRLLGWSFSALPFGVIEIDLATGGVELAGFPTPSNPGAAIQTLFFDDAGTLWAAGVGLFRYDTSLGDFVQVGVSAASVRGAEFVDAPCTTDADCIDPLFCNGVPSCNASGVCELAPTCDPGFVCREAKDTCEPLRVPTASEWGLIVMAGLLLLVGARLFGRAAPTP